VKVALLSGAVLFNDVNAASGFADLDVPAQAATKIVVVAIFAISLLPDDCMHPKPAFPLQLTATRAEVRSEVGVGCGLYIE
jgi:hypothetical protein